MKLPVFACALAVVASGCSTIKRDMVFDGSGDEAFVLVAADGMFYGTESYSFGLQRIDVEQKNFQPEIRNVFFSGEGPIKGDELRKPEELKTTLRFGGERVPPGEYALISRTDYHSLLMENSSKVTCFSEGAPVFRIRPGHINILPGGDVRGYGITDRELLQSHVKTVLAGYPNISAPVAFAEYLGTTSFETTARSLIGVKICKGGPVSSFVAVPN